MEYGHKMNTLSEIMKILRTEGYKEDFEMTNRGFITKNHNLELSPKYRKIRKIYRFEGESNPADNSVLYAMETNNNIKRILVDAYRTYAGNESA